MSEYQIPAKKSFLRVAQRLVKNWKRDFKNYIFAKRFSKKPIGPYPDHGYHVIVKKKNNSGLSRAYQYQYDDLMKKGLINPNSRNVLIFDQPLEWRKLIKFFPDNFSDLYRIGVCVTEFDVMPTDWERPIEIVHEVWVPSEFSARALCNKGVEVKVVPYPVSVPQGIKPLSRHKFNISDDAFLGLAIMDLRHCPDRKNPLAHIAAWQMAFGNDANCQLIIKANFSKKTRFSKDVILSAIANASNIQLLEMNLSDEEMYAFQKMADVYLSLHRSEGYGLNIRESLEHGIPVIATGYSANLDYMYCFNNAHSVNYVLVPYFDPTNHYRGRHLQWADPKALNAAVLLRKLCFDIKCHSQLATKT